MHNMGGSEFYLEEKCLLYLLHFSSVFSICIGSLLSRYFLMQFIHLDFGLPQFLLISTILLRTTFKLTLAFSLNLSLRILPLLVFLSILLTIFISVLISIFFFSNYFNEVVFGFRSYDFFTFLSHKILFNFSNLPVYDVAFLYSASISLVYNEKYN